jgi:3D-(3,5/4)-trihydroxycyclohexane-1,2-dione acylhydrolase (decyclizing)
VRLTTAQALVGFLAVQESERDGVRRPVVGAMLGIFGHGNVCGIGQALAEPGALRFQQTKHEQAMVHTALGYAKATRRLATLACTASIGPGATNLVTGAATATTNRLPVLLLPGDTFASRLQGPVLQQLQHPSHGDWSVNEALRPVSRYFDRISRPEQLLDALPEAMRVLLDPAEAGAVTIALYQDVQGEAYEFPDAFFSPRVWPVTRRPAARGEIEAVAALLRAASRPLIIAGGGVRYSEAEAALAALSARGVPIAETSAGKGMGSGPLALGGIGVNGTGAANAIAADADVVLCVGTRLSDFTTGSRSLFAGDARFAAINVCAADAHRMGALPVVADAREALAALDEALGDWRADGGRAARELARWDETVRESLEPAVGLAPGRALRAINAAARAGDWVVAAAGSPPGDLLKLWHCPPGTAAHLEFAFSCMGHEIPAGIGIRMAEPEAGEIVVVIGDGTYLMAPTELVTAVQECLKVTVVVLVNGGYRSIESLQRSSLGIRFGNAFAAEVDYAANAASLGCAVWDVDDEAALEAALAGAREQPRPAVIACHVDPEAVLPAPGAWWDLGIPEVAADPAVAAAAAEPARGAARQRWYG